MQKRILLLGLLMLVLVACGGQDDAVAVDGPDEPVTSGDEIVAEAEVSNDAPDNEEVAPAPTDSPAVVEDSAESEPTPAQRIDPATYDDLEIITLLPRDAIPAIDNPTFQTAGEAEYDPDELVMGVVFNGEARAYSIPYLSRHEIVNDTVGGHKIAVTW